MENIVQTQITRRIEATCPHSDYAGDYASVVVEVTGAPSGAPVYALCDRDGENITVRGFLEPYTVTVLEE